MTPARALIPNVPFIAFGGVAREDLGILFPSWSNIQNPSIAAATAMILRYWAGEPMPPLADLVSARANWRTDTFDVSTVKGLKETLAGGVPVLLPLGLTPWGHPFGGPDFLVAGLPQVGPHSGILGTILSFDTFDATHPLRRAHLRESVSVAARVVVGYDDEREIMILHDPSFGPGWEVSYEDFERMWEPMRETADAGVPPDFRARARAAARAGVAVYRDRSTEERALELFVYGYALACTQHRTMAVDRYRTGLALPQLGNGFRHLFLVELALQSQDRSEAIALLREATMLVPANHIAWRILADIYRQRRWDRLRAVLAQFRARLASGPTQRSTFAAARPKGILWWPG